MATRSGANSSRKIVIFAREVASAVGRHRYQSRQQTFREVWLRSHQQSFCFAHTLQFKDDICHLLTQTEELKTQFPSLEGEVELVDFGLVLRKIICDVSLRKVYHQILSFLKGKLFKSTKEEQLLVNANVVEQIIAEQMKTLCKNLKNEEKPVESIVKEICVKTGVEKKEVVEAMESKITKDRGTQLEKNAVLDFGKEKGLEIERPPVPELYYRDMEYDGITWSVCGKVDAETEDTVIEVKNRKSRFMCPEYDYIQLQSYLFICKKPKGVLLERLRGQNRETCFDFDEELWKELTSELAEFVGELSEAMNMTKQTLYGYCSPRKREHDKMSQSEPVSFQATDEEPEPVKK